MKRWLNPVVLATAIVLFVVSRWEYLFLPYFWDEMGVYAHGALIMSEHGLGLLPSSLNPELSRGHPLLFYFLAALNFQIFGTSLVRDVLDSGAHYIRLFYCISAVQSQHWSYSSIVFDRSADHSGASYAFAT